MSFRFQYFERVMKQFRIDFVPLKIPTERRLQTCVVLLQVLLFLFLGVGSLLLLIVLLFTKLYFITFLYLAWYVYDFNQENHGGRKVNWVTRLPIWNYFRDYFPIKLIKTAELDPEKNYIIGIHPHGIIPFSVFCNFVSEATEFSTLFRGIRSVLLVSQIIFRLPVARDYALIGGACNVSKESIKYLMKTKGVAAAIVIGGAREVFEANPGETKLVLKNRKGFIKIALQTGAYLVPAFSFGENDVYNIIGHSDPGSLTRFLQNQIQKVTGCAPVLFSGRGVFNYTFGILPHRKPITTVVGNAIPVVQTEEPTQQEIDELHQRYMCALKELFDIHKATWGSANDELKFID